MDVQVGKSEEEEVMGEVIGEYLGDVYSCVKFYANV